MASTGGSSSDGGGGSGNNTTKKDPWAWLGLLKWSLAYSDGTSDKSNFSKMSDENRAFLEAVMKEGIIDENERMKVILQQVTEVMSEWKEKQQTAAPPPPNFDFDAEQVDQVQGLLQELRDIVEQIDYARAFCALGGLEFLLGTLLSLQNDSSSSSAKIPDSIVELGSGILATLSTNNPPVQMQLLEMGSIRILTNAYFSCDSMTTPTTTTATTINIESNNDNRKARSRLQSRILQAMSAIVRSHATAEQVFCETAQATPLLQHCLGVRVEQTEDAANGTSDETTHQQQQQPAPPLELQQRGLFFLRALVISDTSTPERIQRFGPCITTVMDRFVLGDSQHDNHDELFVQLREMTLAMIQQLLEASSSNDSPFSSCPPVLWTRKDALGARGVQRVTALRTALSTTNNENDDEYTRAQYQSELNHWEAILVLLARATPPPIQTTNTTNPLMIAAAPETTPSQ